MLLPSASFSPRAVFLLDAPLALVEPEVAEPGFLFDGDDLLYGVDVVVDRLVTSEGSLLESCFSGCFDFLAGVPDIFPDGLSGHPLASSALARAHSTERLLDSGLVVVPDAAVGDRLELLEGVLRPVLAVEQPCFPSCRRAPRRVGCRENSPLQAPTSRGRTPR